MDKRADIATKMVIGLAVIFGLMELGGLKTELRRLNDAMGAFANAPRGNIAIEFPRGMDVTNHNPFMEPYGMNITNYIWQVLKQQPAPTELHVEAPR